MTTSHLRRDMVNAMRDLLGSGWVDAYYESAAADFIAIAESYLEDAQEEQRDFPETQCRYCKGDIEQGSARWWALSDHERKYPLCSVICWRICSGYTYNVVTKEWDKA